MKLFAYRIALTLLAIVAILPIQLLVYTLLGFMEWAKSLVYFWREEI